jgi:hypothetical protein
MPPDLISMGGRRFGLGDRSRPCLVRSGLRGIGGDLIPFYTNLYRRGLNPLQSPLNPFKPNKPPEGRGGRRVDVRWKLWTRDHANQCEFGADKKVPPGFHLTSCSASISLL